MTKAMRTTLRATLASMPFIVAAIFPAVPAWAQSEDSEEDESPAAEAPAEEAAPDEPQPATPAEAEPAQAAPAVSLPPSPAPIVMPPPAGNPPPHLAYPYPPPRRPEPQVESEGPATSWDPLRFAVALEGRGSWLLDKGAKRLAGERTPVAAGLSLQGDVLQARDGMAIRLDIGWVTDSHTSYRYGMHSGAQSQEKLDTDLLWLGVAVRYPVLRWLAPYLRLSGGLGWQELTVADMSNRERFAHGTAGAGFFLRSPGIRASSTSSFPALGFVAQIEAGYALAPGSDVELSASPASGNDAPIPTSSVTLGRAGRSAPYLRACFGLAF